MGGKVSCALSAWWNKPCGMPEMGCMDVLVDVLVDAIRFVNTIT